MGTGGPKPLGGLLAHASGDLGRLIEEARRLARATEVLRARLPAPLNEHSRVASLAGGVLVLQADSAAWASRLRFVTREMAEALAPVLGRVTRVRVTVASPTPPPPTKPLCRPERAVLSKELARSLAQAAEGISDPALQEALRRLARTAAGPGEEG